MDSTDSGLDQDDVLYPCKGCGEILEEGKAFELAGNRWHIDCFRCHTCNTPLDSDANLLLLGDGSLICNNCTYSCSACGNKIEDLAILTGDQAFCASCFRCRNCRKKIENLRYARTSQGIFCMACHEALMARRRKKSKNAKSAAANPAASPSAVLDKSLPALPPTDAPIGELPANNFDTVERSSTGPAGDASSYSKFSNIQKPSPDGFRLELSPSNLNGSKANLTLPSTTYSAKRSSTASKIAMGDDDFFIKVALDPSPGPFELPPSQPTIEKQPSSESKSAQRDYFGHARHDSNPGLNDTYRDMITGSSRSASVERSSLRSQARGNPHLTYQERGRQNSSDHADSVRKRRDIGVSTPASDTAPAALEDNEKFPMSSSSERPDSGRQDQFRLQDAPRWRNSSGSKRGSVAHGLAALRPSEESGNVDAAGTGDVPVVEDASRSPLMRSPQELGTSTSSSPPLSGISPGNTFAERPMRGDSLKSPFTKQTIPRKEVPPRSAEGDFSALVEIPSKSLERNLSKSSSLAKQSSSPPNAKLGSAPPLFEGTAFYDTNDDYAFNFGNRAMPTTLDEEVENSEHPGIGPPAPIPSLHHRNTSVNSLHSDKTTLIPRTQQLASADMVPDSDLSRFPTRGEDVESYPSVFRRVSNAVKHGRSLSDRGSAGALASPKWSKVAPDDSIDISSPIVNIAEAREDPLHLRNRLRISDQRVVELEARVNSLQEQVNGTADIKQVNSELREKRTTMAFLETQREMVVRELETLTNHLQRAKSLDTPVDIDAMKSEVLREFATSLQKLKDTLGTEIEDLVQRKICLNTELTNLIQMRDKSLQEYENLSSKNAQLVELNGQLMQNIQEIYRQGRHANGVGSRSTSSSNGLGIYTAQRSESVGDLRSVLSHDTAATSQMSGDTEVEAATVLPAPQVVNIRKGQPRKFNWKKGGHAVAKNVSKGFKGAFGSANQNQNSSTSREDQFETGLPYGSMISGPLPTSTAGEQPKPGWNFLGQKPGITKSIPGMKDAKDGGYICLPAESALFGSELEARSEFERRVIPNIVTACIAEVELRGMALEGIYRKSGSALAVNSIKQGFENSQDYDISDPDMDIHAVTSALKQYFRKLPTPLITYDSYDGLLEAAAEEDDDIRAENVRDALATLPRSHRDCLEFLIFHLVRVVERESQNLMTPHNLAVIFAPTIMRPLTIEREMSDMQAQRAVVLALLYQNKLIFGDRE